MKLIQNIINFFRKEKIKMLPAPVVSNKEDTKLAFKNSIKVEIYKNKVGTLTCVGDGLGIETISLD